MIDLKTIDEHIAKAKEDLSFWEKAREVFLDPRISGGAKHPDLAPALPPASNPSSGFRLYGELRGRVREVLPEHDSVPGITTKVIVERLRDAGYVFTAKLPEVSVNEALVALERRGEAKVVGKVGIARLWTKGESQEAPSGAS